MMVSDLIHVLGILCITNKNALPSSLHAVCDMQ